MCGGRVDELAKYKQKYEEQLVKFFVPYPVMKGFSDLADEVVEGKLFLSSASATKDNKWLTSHSITGVLNCAGPESGLSPEAYKDMGLTYLCLNMQDVEGAMEAMSLKIDQAVDFIDESTKVIVNCAAGVSRSATVVLAWLIQRQQLSLYEAFSFLRSRRKFVYPNRGFWKLLMSLEKEPSIPPEALEMHGRIE